MKDLHEAVQRAIRDVEAVMAALDSNDADLRAHQRQTLDMQLQSLRVVDGELHERVVTRRVWSLGEATVPVVRALLKAAGKPKIGLAEGVVEQAQSSIAGLRRELIRFAEGR